MSDVSEARQVWPARPAVLRMVLMQCALVFLLLIVWQQRWGTIPDTSWLITESLRYLDGERLYVDLMENNPPFTVWLFLPALLVSRWVGISPETCMALYTCLAVIVGLCLSAAIIHKGGLAEGRTLLRQAPLFVALFVILPGSAFTERDQVGAVLFLPLLAMMAWRADNRNSVAPSIGLIVATALCGSVLVLLKPYYVAACVLPALYVVWRRKNIWAVLAPENCIIAMTGVVYIGLIFWLCPEFIHDILPQVADIYMGSGSPLKVAAQYGPTYLAILLLIWLVTPGERITPLCAVATLASLASLGALIYQGKGWAYHAFPAISLGFVAVLCRIAASKAWGYNRATLGRLALCLMVLALAWRPFLLTQKPNADFVAAVKAVSTPTSTLAIIGSDLAGAHPLTRMVGARFASANNSDWLGFLALDLSHQAEAIGDAAGVARYRQMSETYLDAKYAEFTRNNYDLIVVEDDQPIWTDYVFAQPRYKALISAYRPIANDGRFRVFSRLPAAESFNAGGNLEKTD